MSILAIFTADTTKSQYEALRKEVNWERKHPDGGVFHAAAFDDAGKLCVADVWTSAEALNAFVEGRLMPAFKKLGLEPPKATVYEAHNINAYKGIEAHRI